MQRREFIIGAISGGLLAGCGSLKVFSNGKTMPFGVCCGPEKVGLVASVGFDFWEWGAAGALGPDKDAEWWKRQRDLILGQPIPLRSCNGFLPGTFRLTGPKADFAPALAYAETVLRRAEEVGIKCIVFGSGGARNVPGDYANKSRDDWPKVEKGAEQYAEFCRELASRTSDLKTVQVLVEPLRPNESNIINYVWQGVQICREIDSPRIAQLADIFHMMMGRESAESLLKAGSLLRHCHIATYGTRQFPGSDPAEVGRFVPYFEALKSIGYVGGVSCECGWGEKGDYAKNLEIALGTLKKLGGVS